MYNKFYGLYKQARNGSWQCIIDYGIKALPVDVINLATQAGVTVLQDSQANLLCAGESGLTIVQNNQFYIVYKDSEIPERCRFTIAHELGHIFAGDILIDTPAGKTFSLTPDNESAAYLFARDLLAPACVLHELQILTPTEIKKACYISMPVATKRAERMAVLEQRNAWYTHPLECQVRNQFLPFIMQYRNMS